MNPKIFGQQTIVQDEQYNLHPQLRQIHDMMRNAKCIFGNYGFVNPTIFNNLIIGPFLKYRNRQCPHYNLTWCTPWLVSGPSMEATHLFRLEQSNLCAWSFGWIIDPREHKVGISHWWKGLLQVWVAFTSPVIKSFTIELHEIVQHNPSWIL